MERIFLLKGLDCPNCSAKIEKEVGDLENVNSSSVNLMKQTLTIQTETFDNSIVEQIETIVHSHEPDVEVSEKKESYTTKTYLLKGLDCPNCSAKIEKEVGDLEDVSSSVVNLMKQTLTISVKTSASGKIQDEVATIVHSHEPDVKVSEQTDSYVTKKYLLKGLDCPNCSAKIEKEVGELEGVALSEVNLMKQTLTVSMDHNKAASMLDMVTTIVHSHEPDVEVSEQKADTSVAPDKKEKTPVYSDDDKKLTIRLISGAVIYAVGMGLTLFGHVSLPVELGVLIVAYIILGWDVVWQAVKNITRGQIFDEHFLMSLSTIGAFAIGEYPEAVAVMLFYQVGEFFQSLAVKRSRKSISDLMDIRPDSATVRRNGELVVVAPETVSIGELIVVKPGEKIPLDGIVTEGESMLDTRALTGESVPRSIRKGEEALSGCVNQSGVLTIKVTKAFGESTVSKILELVENASSKKAKTERFITRFAKVYTPIVVGLAIALAIAPPLIMATTGSSITDFYGVWSPWIYRALTFLVVSCPCALVISVPLSFFAGIGAASTKGVLVKGSNYLELISKCDTVVFDKTGTLTKGVFKVSKINANVDEKKFLEMAVVAEMYSNHPIAKSLKDELINKDKSVFDGIQARQKDIKIEEIHGRGIKAELDGSEILAGNGKLLDMFKIPYEKTGEIGTIVYVAVDNQYLGYAVIEDTVKETSLETIRQLKSLGVKNTVMLTGDRKEIAEKIAKELNLDSVYSELLPEDKVRHVEELLKTSGVLAFVGDGVNDAPVLARADIGIAMGAMGSDAAIEAADIVLMDDNPKNIGKAIKIGRKTMGIAKQNIIFALAVKVLVLILAAVGIASMWAAVFADVGVCVVAILNAMRAGKLK